MYGHPQTPVRYQPGAHIGQSDNQPYHPSWYQNQLAQQAAAAQYQMAAAGYNMSLGAGQDESQLWHHPMFNSHMDYLAAQQMNQQHPSGMNHGSQNSYGDDCANSQSQVLNGGSQLPSPTGTASGSDMSSPGGHHGSASPPDAHAHQSAQSNRNVNNRSPYEWIRKNNYQTQPTPGEQKWFFFIWEIVKKCGKLITRRNNNKNSNGHK